MELVLARKKPVDLMMRFELVTIGGGVGGRVGVSGENRRGDQVDPLVGGLRRQDRCDQQLKR